MRIRVRLFAAARQFVEKDAVEVELTDRATVAELREQLAAEFPELAAIVGRAAFAVDEAYAGDATILDEQVDVACIPPVSGG
jgi:molybdopterin converting factor subunit 1